MIGGETDRIKTTHFCEHSEISFAQTWIFAASFVQMNWRMTQKNMSKYSTEATATAPGTTQAAATEKNIYNK